MIKRSLLELATSELFTSPTQIDLLLDLLRGKVKFAPADDFSQWHAQRLEGLATSLDGNHSRRFRRTDLDHAFGGLVPSDMFETPMLPMMDALFDKLMVRNGDYLHYRDDQVQAYARLAADLDPTLLTGWHLAGWLSRYEPLQPSDFRRIVNGQRLFHAPVSISNKPFAEGHVHLGGIAFDSVVLISSLFAVDSESKADREILRRLRRILVQLIERDQEKETPRDSSIIKDLKVASGAEPFEPPLPLNLYWHYFQFSKRPEREIDGPWLLRQVADALRPQPSGAPRYAEGWSWLVIWLWHTYRQEQTPLTVRVAIFYLFSELMRLRRQLIMDGQGLTRFTEDYAHVPLAGIAKNSGNAENIARMFSAPGDLVEFKVSAGMIKPIRFSEMANAIGLAQGSPLPQDTGAFGFPDYRPMGPAHEKYLQSNERWHFCMHFSRSSAGRKKNKLGRRLAPEHDAKKCWKSAQEVLRALDSENHTDHPAFLGGVRNPNFHFQPSRWLRGLDVAGDENALRIEWFAPVLRWMRSHVHAHREGHMATPGFHLSIHAGEDYAHPLSGMRHVDETVRFCDMRNGDRLGHGLALGIPPRDWCMRQGDMILSVDEHLDNLVWMWHYACELGGRIELASRIISRLERRIARVAAQVGWCNGLEDMELLAPLKEGAKAARLAGGAQSGPSPDLLFQAWQLRHNCHYQFEQNHPVAAPEHKLAIAVPDYDRLARGKASLDGGQNSAASAVGLYLLRHMFISAGRTKPPRTVIVEVADNGKRHQLAERHADDPQAPLRDFDTLEELEFMHALQDYLLDNYDRKGLIIETNPTSNVYVARLEHHGEHPIFRWNPPDERKLRDGGEFNRYGLRRGPMRVLINTDDPGIMPTTLRTEFELMREAAIDLGYSRTVAEDWLERLRQFGVDQFHRNHHQVFTPI
jgi:hypothetical protein